MSQHFLASTFPSSSYTLYKKQQRKPEHGSILENCVCAPSCRPISQYNPARDTGAFGFGTSAPASFILRALSFSTRTKLLPQNIFNWEENVAYFIQNEMHSFTSAVGLYCILELRTELLVAIPGETVHPRVYLERINQGSPHTQC